MEFPGRAIYIMRETNNYKSYDMRLPIFFPLKTVEAVHVSIEL